MTLHPQFIEQDGQKHFAILPIAEFEKLKDLLEDVLDEADMHQAKEQSLGQPRFSLKAVKAQLLNG